MPTGGVAYQRLALEGVACVERLVVHSNRSFEMFEDHKAELGHVAGSKGENEVARLGGFGRELGGIGKRGDISRVPFAVLDDSFGKVLARHAGNWCFASGVDVKNGDGVGVVESSGKFIEQQLGAR